MSAATSISVGLTGLMGSGKTEAAKFFQRAGYPVLFMDQVGHACLQKPEIVQVLVDAYGSEILNLDQTINRKELSSIVFNNSQKLKRLNAILHPVMNQQAKDWINHRFKQRRHLVFIEAAILFEMQMNKFLDFTVLIKAAENDLIERIKKRDQKSELVIQKILQAQSKNENHVDYVLLNEGTLEDLYHRCKNLLEILKQKTVI